MPQTLLSLLAVFSAGILTLSQVESQHHNVESVVRDQFELAVGGTLLHAMEFVDSRAFDAATTPARLRARYGLPSTMPEAERDTISFDDLIDFQPDDFSHIASFGGAPCNVADPIPATSGCDDVDDISGNPWQAVVLETPDGSPLPVEVRVVVDYVEASDSDVPVDYRTFHKRVQINARTTALRNRDGFAKPIEVSLSRVLSFDPKVAAEYLRRSIAVEGEGGTTCEAEVGDWNSIMSALREQLSQLTANRDAISSTLASANDALSQAQGAQASADAAAQSALSERNSARSARDAAASTVTSAQSALSGAQSALESADAAKRAAQRAVGSAEEAQSAAQQAVVTADNALDAAQDAHQAAEAERAVAQAARDEAYDIAIEAQQAQNAAYDEAIDAYYEATYVAGNGNRRWRSNAWRAYFEGKWAEYEEAFYDFDEKRDDYYAANSAANAAANAASAAANALANAEAAIGAAADAVSAANATLSNARAAADQARSDLAAAASAVTAAESAVSDAQQALANAQATYDTANDAYTAAAATAASAASATAAAQSEVNDITIEWQDAEDQVTDAQRDVDDHQSTYPSCETA